MDNKNDCLSAKRFAITNMDHIKIDVQSFLDSKMSLVEYLNRAKDDERIPAKGRQKLEKIRLLLNKIDNLITKDEAEVLEEIAYTT